MTTVSTDTENTSWAMWQSWLSTDTTFCRALVGCGYLSEEQMQRAAGRYRLGRSHDGGVIFWQIDQKGVVRDGKIMYYREDCHRDKARNPSWVSARMKAYYGYDGSLPVERCLFGLHLLSEKGAVAIVEAEKTAVIMSERFPQYIWMAAGGPSAHRPPRRTLPRHRPRRQDIRTVEGHCGRGLPPYPLPCLRQPAA